MKLIRFGNAGEERPGVFMDGRRLDCSGGFRDWDGPFFEGDGIRQLTEYLRQHPELPEVDEAVRWAAPIARPWKVLCIGLNYRDHAEEAGMPIPDQPILFMKASNCVVGPYDPLPIPRHSEKTDWEVELGVVIGKTCRYLESESAALDCIAGYCISHDVSERAFQLEMGGQWVKGKSCDSFNPLGPWLATPEELPEVGNLSLSLSVNGTRRQAGNTSTMVFGVAEIIRYLSNFMTLEPGDLINTGTPPGVGLGMKPPRYLRAGDVLELEIEGLGRQRQTCKNAVE